MTRSSGALASIGRAFLPLVFVIVAAVLGPSFITRGSVSPLTNAVDFRAFYCAGAAVVGRDDPYRVEPLRSCEVRNVDVMGLRTYEKLVTPAPLPPYAIVPFAVLSFVPYPSAVCAWFALLLACVVIASLAAVRLTGARATLVALVVAVSALNAMMLGQVAPLICALLLLAALAFAARAWSVTSLFLGLAMLEPHLALPAVATAFVLEPAMRPRLAFVAAVLVKVSVLAVGPAVALEYVTTVVPLHALSEANALQAQYSLTTLLATFGVPVLAAVRAGEIDYVVTVVASIVLARALYVRGARPLVILLPSALAMIGGVYVHLYAFCIVVVAALVLRANAAPRVRRLCDLAIAGILVSMVLDNAFAPDLMRPYTADVARRVESAVRPDAFASSVARLWHTFRMSEDPRVVLAIVAIKIPAYCGMLALAFAALGAAGVRGFARRDQAAGGSILGKSGISSGATTTPSASLP